MYIVTRLRYETKLTEKYRSEGVNVLLLNDCNAISECLFITDHIVEMSPVQVPAILLWLGKLIFYCLIFRWREVGHTLGFGSKENEWAITTVKWKGQNKFSCGEKAALRAFLAFPAWPGNQMLMHDKYRNSWD